MNQDDLMCAGCENTIVECFTMHKGTLICSACLEDWLKSEERLNCLTFDAWLVNQRHRMREDRRKPYEREEFRPTKKNKLKEFKYKCLCDWSKDDEYGFIPHVNCPAHGKKTKELLKKAVPVDLK